MSIFVAINKFLVTVDVEPNEAQLLVELIEILLKDWYVAREQKRLHLEAVVKLTVEKESVQKRTTI